MFWRVEDEDGIGIDGIVQAPVQACTVCGRDKR